VDVDRNPVQVPQATERQDREAHQAAAAGRVVTKVTSYGESPYHPY
jgi:hypothetical protein